jgi:uroporphyrinogen decarboxylase
LGAEVKWPTGEFDQCPNIEPVVNNEEEAWALKMPDRDQLKEAGFMPLFLEFARIATSNGLPFMVPTYASWTTAGNIVGIERLSRWVLKKKDLAHHVVRFATDFLVMFNQIIVDEVGPEGFTPGPSTASAANNIISPKTFEEFVLPYLIEYHEKLIEMGAQSILLHICGEQNLNYEFYKQVPLPPVSVISVSHEVDLEKASATFPDYIIAGNINPSIIQMGNPEEVYEACRVAIEKGKKHKRGFALAPGCEMPPQSPPYNVWMMAKACNDFGYYD